MATGVITLSSPQEYDLQSLAETTRQSLALLKPWTLLKPSPDNALVGDIAAQAAKYVAAIQTGVSAAYSGFTVTEEVLFLASAFPIEDQEDLQRYLVGMMELAKEARDNANKAYDAFRNVRQEIYAITSEVKAEELASEKNGDMPHATMREGLPDYHQKDVDVLVKFADHISTFANWWDWVKVETDPSGPKDQPISFHLDTLRDPEVVKRWNHLRSQYTAYVQMIGEMEDADPQFFSRSSTSAVPQTVPDTARPESPPTSRCSSSGAQKNASPPQSQPTAFGASPSAQANQEGKVPTFNETTPKAEIPNNPRAKSEKPKKGIRARFAEYFKKKYPKVANKCKSSFRNLKERGNSIWVPSQAAGDHEGQSTPSALSTSITGKPLSAEPAQGLEEKEAASVDAKN